jgi:hypothetical protein
MKEVLRDESNKLILDLWSKEKGKMRGEKTLPLIVAWFDS